MGEETPSIWKELSNVKASALNINAYGDLKHWNWELYMTLNIFPPQKRQTAVVNTARLQKSGSQQMQILNLYSVNDSKEKLL